MSVADDDLFQEPVEAPARSSRRSGGGGGSGRGPRLPRGRDGGSPLQQPRIRGLIALGLLVIVALILISTIRGCQRDKVVSSYHSYLASANAIAGESQDLGKQLQKLLDNKELLKKAAIMAKVSDLATSATSLVERAKKLKPPDRLSAPNRTLVTALEYRAQGLAELPKAIDGAITAKEVPVASTTLAAPLQILAASDVIYRTSYKAPSENAIQQDRIKDVQVAESEFFPGSTYDKTSPAGAIKVIANIKQARVSTDPVTGSPTAASTHGLSISKVVVVRGGKSTQLIPGTLVSLIPDSKMTFDVIVENGGDFLESNIDVKFTYKSPNDPTGTTQTQTIAEISPGGTNQKTLSFTLNQQPYLTAPSTIIVDVATVPGEKVSSNNRGEYPVEFTLQ
jgi:hypothetical protein